ncbi:MAG TPA: hypothetical protein DEQ14_10710, partial [Treponema sp.]|nr:hypothetical protein [Treponema sp.]
PIPYSHYPAKPDSRGIAQAASRLERKGGGRGMWLCAGKRVETAPLSLVNSECVLENYGCFVYFGFYGRVAV